MPGDTSGQLQQIYVSGSQESVFKALQGISGTANAENTALETRCSFSPQIEMLFYDPIMSCNISITAHSTMYYNELFTSSSP